MKLNELSKFLFEELQHQVKINLPSFFTEARWLEERDLKIPPSPTQLHILRCLGFVIGPNLEVCKLDENGMLRECVHGLPCRWFCCGLADGKCSQHPFPSCGVADGACQMTNKPCHKSCKAGE